VFKDSNISEPIENPKTEKKKGATTMRTSSSSFFSHFFLVGNGKSTTQQVARQAPLNDDGRNY